LTNGFLLSVIDWRRKPSYCCPAEEEHTKKTVFHACISFVYSVIKKKVKRKRERKKSDSEETASSGFQTLRCPAHPFPIPSDRCKRQLAVIG
jgi:hypothetical protein